MIRGAEKVGLPSDVRKLAGLVDSPAELARLSAALVRVSRKSRAADEIKRAATA